MNVKEGIPRLNLALALIGLTLGSTHHYLVTTYILAAVLILYGTVTIFENKKPKPIPQSTWGTIVNSAKNLDMTWFAFGLGMLNLSTKFFANSLIWPGIILLISFGLCATLNSAQLIGRGGAMLLSQNVKVGIIFGFIMLTGGAIWLVLSWNTGNTSTILLRLNNVIVQIVIVCMGIMLICFGFRMRKTK